MVGRRKLLVAFYIFILLLIILSAYLKITHWKYDSLFMELTLILYGVFDVVCLFEIYQSKTLKKTEKWMYAIAVIFLGVVGGALYLLRPERRESSSRI